MSISARTPLIDLNRAHTNQPITPAHQSQPTTPTTNHSDIEAQRSPLSQPHDQDETDRSKDERVKFEDVIKTSQDNSQRSTPTPKVVIPSGRSQKSNSVEDGSIGYFNQSTINQMELPITNSHRSSNASTSRHAPISSTPSSTREEEKQHETEQQPSTAVRPVVVSRSSSKAVAAAASTSGTKLKSPKNGGSPVRPSKLGTSASMSRLKLGATEVPASVINFEFPTAESSNVTPKKQQVSGVFQTYFSPKEQGGHAGYQIWNNAHSGISANSPSLSPSAWPDNSPSHSARMKPIEKALKKRPSSRSGASPLRGSSSTRTVSSSSSNGAADASFSPQITNRGNAGGITGMGLGHSTSEITLSSTLSTSQSALGIANASAAAYAAAEAYTAATGSTSFARRMIHAQSAAELSLASPPPQLEPISDDPDAASIFFQPGPNGLPETFQERINEVAAQPESQALVPFTATTHSIPANPSYSYGNYSTHSAAYGARPQTAGVSSSGIPWSTTLTATLTEDAKLESTRTPTKKKQQRPQTSGASGRRLPGSASSSALDQAALPPELTVGLDAMSPHMQREHAALARLIQGLEPAGKASLTSGSVFTRMGGAARSSLFSSGGATSPVKGRLGEPSQLDRIEYASESDEFLRKRSIQKSIENQRQQSAAFANRGASGLAGNNLSSYDVSRAVEKLNEEYTISEERPKPARPPSAQPMFGVAAGVSAAGSRSATDLIQQVTSPKKLIRPGTSAGRTPTRSPSTGSLRPSTASAGGRSDESSSFILPGHGLTSPNSVLGFGGSIDRFSNAIEEFRHVNISTSHIGGRGMMSSKSATKLLSANIPVNGAEPPPTGAAVASNKKFTSLALEFEVALAERLARIPTGTASAALERLDVFRTAFDSVILHEPNFGGLLAKIKGEYEAYSRRGGGNTGGNTKRNGPNNASLAEQNQQQVEDTLILENHRLHTKLHGFQRAYTSLYAKYKNLLHTQKVQEGILNQNILIMQDLNEQLQHNILHNLKDQDRRRKEELQAKLLKSNKKLVNVEYDDNDLDLLNEGTDASLKKLQQRKLAQQQAAALAAEEAKKVDPLERGRELMRNFKLASTGQNTGASDSKLSHDAQQNLIDPASGESVLSPMKLINFLDDEHGQNTTTLAVDSNTLAAATVRLSKPNQMDAELLANESDPLDYLQKHSRRELEMWKEKHREMEEKMLKMQTQLDQSRAKELAALMAVEDFSKQAYLRDRAAAAAATGAEPSPTNSKTPRTSSTSKRDSLSLRRVDETNEQLSPTAASTSTSVIPTAPIPSEPTQPEVTFARDADELDEDPDGELAASQPSSQRQQVADMYEDEAYQPQMSRSPLIDEETNVSRKTSLIQQSRRHKQ